MNNMNKRALLLVSIFTFSSFAPVCAGAWYNDLSSSTADKFRKVWSALYSKSEAAVKLCNANNKNRLITLALLSAVGGGSWYLINYQDNNTTKPTE